MAAVGDIACPPGERTTRTTCRDAATARLARRLEPDAVFALGDLQYPAGRLNDFRRAYDRTWGRLRGRTYPVPGNHEYGAPGARGYYAYFEDRQPGPPGYYARTLGSWRVYFLNSNCSEINCRAQHAWLRERVNRNRRTCAAFVVHHPQFSSGPHGGGSVRGFFRTARQHRVELFLSGHDHIYERFRPMNEAGARVRGGVVQFVVGSGGKSLYPIKKRQTGSAFSRDNRFGVLRLALRSDSYRYAFKTVGGATPDSGRRRCR